MNIGKRFFILYGRFLRQRNNKHTHQNDGNAAQLGSGKGVAHNEDAGQNRNHGGEVGKHGNSGRADVVVGIVEQEESTHRRDQSQIGYRNPKAGGMKGKQNSGQVIAVFHKRQQSERDEAQRRHDIGAFQSGEVGRDAAADHIEQNRGDGCHKQQNHAQRGKTDGAAYGGHCDTQQGECGADTLTEGDGFLQKQTPAQQSKHRYGADDDAGKGGRGHGDAVIFTQEVNNGLYQSQQEQQLDRLSAKIKADFPKQQDQIQRGEGKGQADAQKRDGGGLTQGDGGEQKTETKNGIAQQSCQSSKCLFFHRK